MQVSENRLRRLAQEKGIFTPLNLTVNSTSEAAEAAQYILAQITTGDYKPEERLPAERALAEALKVSRTTIREALTVLEILGVVEIRPGSGAYVRSGGMGLLSDSLQWVMLLAPADYPDILRIRSALEVLAVQLTAESLVKDPQPLKTLRIMRDCLEEQEESINSDNMAAFIDADAAFHIEMAELAGNETLKNLLSTLRRMLSIWMRNQLKVNKDMQIAYAEHLDIFRALDSTDPLQAVDVMREHMKSANERLLRANYAQGKPDAADAADTDLLH